MDNNLGTLLNVPILWQVGGKCCQRFQRNAEHIQHLPAREESMHLEAGMDNKL